MSDVKAKAVWTRCPKCRWRIYNDPIDKSVHDQRCPAEQERRLDSLEKLVEKLTSNVAAVEEQVTAEPEVNLDDIADWDDDSDGSTPESGTVVEDSVIPAGQYFDDEDDYPAQGVSGRV